MAAIDDIEIPSLLLAEQGSAPTTPASGFGRMYAKADGLYFVGDDGVEVGPLGAAGSGGGDLTEIETVSLASAAATISFSSIPSSYKDLVLVGELRTTRPSANDDDIGVRLGNGTVDSGSNYNWGLSTRYHDGSVYADELGGGTSARVIRAVCGNSPAGYRSSVEITIRQYADSTRYRRIDGRSGGQILASTYTINDGTGMWLNTASVVDIVTLFPVTGPNFAAGSVVTLYGRG